MLIDKGSNRWEFNTIEDAVFVANELIAWLKNTIGIDVTTRANSGTDETVEIKAHGETLNNNE